MHEKTCTALHIDALRPFQAQALDALIEGRDVLILMPTSAGKSVIFQGFSIETEKLVLVIEPHLALELDQVAGLRDKGVAAAYRNSLQSDKEQQVLDDIEQGKLRLLYLTPEMLQNTKVQQALLAADIAGVMVDEAHCVYKQGPGFREAYLKIADFVGKLPHRPPVGAFTATATQTTAQYIAKHLGMDDPVVIRGPVTRDNITLRVFPISEELGGIKDADLIEYHKREIIRKRLKHTTDGRVIIYTNTIKRVKALYKHLRKHGFAVGYYHGKCDDKAKRLRRFREGQTRIMVATNAFGLGVNIPDIRLVIHHAPLIGLDDYLQEVGRAGRDGKKAEALLLWHPYDFAINRKLIRKNQLDLTGRELRDRLDALDALEKYAKDTKNCRWQLIRKFFGEKKGRKCKKRCDNCR